MPLLRLGHQPHVVPAAGSTAPPRDIIEPRGDICRHHPWNIDVTALSYAPKMININATPMFSEQPRVQGVVATVLAR
jgi:hypothetical protein